MPYTMCGSIANRYLYVTALADCYESGIKVSGPGRNDAGNDSVAEVAPDHFSSHEWAIASSYLG